MKTYEAILAHTTRNSTKDIFETYYETKENFATIQEIKKHLQEISTKKIDYIYIDDDNNRPKKIGFISGVFWNKDCSHDSKSWQEQIWCSIYETTRKIPELIV